MTNRLIALVGPNPQVSTTAAEALVEHFGYRNVRFGDAARELAVRADPIVASQPTFQNVSSENRLAHIVLKEGWDKAEGKPEIRRFVTDLEAACRWAFGDQAWHALTLGDAKTGKVVISDCRTSLQAEAIREAGGRLVRLVLPGLNPYEPQALQWFTNWDVEIVIETDEAGVVLVDDDSSLSTWARALERWAPPPMPPPAPGALNQREAVAAA